MGASAVRIGAGSSDRESRLALLMAIQLRTAMQTTRAYLEECCWNYRQDLCRADECPCACHSEGSTVNTIGQTIGSLRTAANLKQYILASRASISAQYLNDIEQGSRIPPPETIRRLAEALEVDLPPLLWIWLRQQVGDDLADQMIAVYTQEAVSRAHPAARPHQAGRCCAVRLDS